MTSLKSEEKNNVTETIYGDESLKDFYTLVSQLPSEHLRVAFRKWATENIRVLTIDWTKDFDAPNESDKFYAKKQFSQIAEHLFESSETKTTTFYSSPQWQKINKKTVHVIGRLKRPEEGVS